METTQIISEMPQIFYISVHNRRCGNGYRIRAFRKTQCNLKFSLARTASGEGVVYKMGSIAGKDSKKASWIVRGDASGTYQVAARFYGTMSPFDTFLHPHLP